VGSHGRWKRPLPLNSPHEHMLLREDRVGSHGRWKRPLPSNSPHDHMLLRVDRLGVFAPTDYSLPVWASAQRGVPTVTRTAQLVTTTAFMQRRMRRCSSWRPRCRARSPSMHQPCAQPMMGLESLESTSTAEPRQQQDWILKCLLVAAATLCWEPKPCK
jgi:hypothetical protein